METQDKEKTNWFSDMSWKSALVYIALSIIAGGSSGAGIVATKAVAQDALTRDQADIRYLSNVEAQRLVQSRDRQMEELKKDIKSEIEKTLKKETFEIWQKTWEERQRVFDEKIDRLLEK